MTGTTYTDERDKIVPGASFSVWLRDKSTVTRIVVDDCDLADDGTLTVTGARVYGSGRASRRRSWTISPGERIVSVLVPADREPLRVTTPGPDAAVEALARRAAEQFVALVNAMTDLRREMLAESGMAATDAEIAASVSASIIRMMRAGD